MPYKTLSIVCHNDSSYKPYGFVPATILTLASLLGGFAKPLDGETSHVQSSNICRVLLLAPRFAALQIANS